MARRSTIPAGSSAGAPWTWLRKPSSAYFPALTIPGFASRSEARTSWVLFPIAETMPIPVTATRLIPQKLLLYAGHKGSRTAVLGYPLKGRRLRSGRGRLCAFEEAHSQIFGLVDARAVGLEPAVGDAKHKFAFKDSLQIDAVDDALHRRQDLVGKFDLSDAESPAAAGEAKPAEIEAKELPKRIKAKAAGHHRIALEMAAEEPGIGLDGKFGDDGAFAIGAALLGNFRNAIEHQERRQRELRVACPKQLSAAAGDEIFIFEAGAPFSCFHPLTRLPAAQPCRLPCSEIARLLTQRELGRKPQATQARLFGCLPAAPSFCLV